MGIFNRILFLFKKSSQTNSDSLLREAALNFDGLNPLLAKQLSELEAQIGQFAQVQFELSQERRRMQYEMDALKKSVEESRSDTSPAKAPSFEALNLT